MYGEIGRIVQKSTQTNLKLLRSSFKRLASCLYLSFSAADLEVWVAASTSLVASSAAFNFFWSSNTSVLKA